ncbi:hypothetical protein SDC49_07875 [Lactobacillus sp. R2/2]|nr:hypothetical protein [Lactobacillus sp. R2/2]
MEYQDVDDNNKVITSNNLAGKEGQKIPHDEHDKTINDLINAGYEVASDGFTDGGDKVFNDASQKFVVKMKHKKQTYLPGQNNPLTGKNDDANLIKEVKQTIKYVGTPTPLSDNVQTVKFTREGTVDFVTQKTDYGPWGPASAAFKDVNSPEVTGYEADTKVVKGTQVKSTDQDITITVKYTKINNKQSVIEYQDVDDNNKVITSNNLAGKEGQKIPHDEHDKTINDLINAGYEVASDGFTDGGDKVFNDASQKFVVKMKHKKQTYLPGQNNPLTGKNDDANLIKEVKQTIKYVGTPTPLSDNVQTVKFTREGTVDFVTQKTDYGPWGPASAAFKDVNSPEVTGYEADTKVVKGRR